MLTTTSMTTVSVSTRSAQSTDSVPEVNQLNTGMRVASAPPSQKPTNATHDSTAAMTRKPDVTSSAGREPSAAGS